MSDSKLLKKDLFGEIRLQRHPDRTVIVRDCGPAAGAVRWLARRLMLREARALQALGDLDGVPTVIRRSEQQLVRRYLAGEPMQRGKPADPAYFKAAARLLRRMHRAGVAHNDLAKEPNFLVTPAGNPAIIDFQLAIVAPRRGKLFRIAAREDLRHLLKHKRSYCPQHLTTRERAILEQPGWLASAWRRTVKPAYNFLTRRVLGWSDREGATDRGAAER